MAATIGALDSAFQPLVDSRREGIGVLLWPSYLGRLLSLAPCVSHPSDTANSNLVKGPNVV